MNEQPQSIQTYQEPPRRVPGCLSWLGWLVVGLLALIGGAGLVVLVVALLGVGDVQARLIGLFQLSPTPSPALTETPPPPTVTVTMTLTLVPSATRTATPTATHTATPTATPTPSATPTATFTPTVTPTATATPTATQTPTPTIPPNQTILTLIQRDAVLRTVRYHYEKVVPQEIAQHMGGIAGERILYVGVGYINAGVSIGELDTEDIIVDASGNVTIILPPAHLTDCVLDPQRSYIYQHDVGVVNFLWDVLYDEPDLLEMAERGAIMAFRDSALEAGILEQAQRDAEWHLGYLLRTSGFNSVAFLTDTGAEPVHDPGCYALEP